MTAETVPQKRFDPSFRRVEVGPKRSGVVFNPRRLEHSQTSDNNFLEFSQTEEYRAVNRDLLRRTVEHLPQENFVHVDVGAGVGLVAELMMEMATEMGKTGRIVCIEPDRFAVKQSRKNVKSNNGINVEFGLGDGEHLKELLKGKIPEEGVDSVSMHDALHEVRGLRSQMRVLRNMYDILKDDGIGSINSAFTTVAMGDDKNAQGYGRWIAYGFRALGGRGKRAEEKNKNQDESTVIRPPENYFSMMKRVGFEVIESRKTIQMTAEALKAIARYPRFAQGAKEDFQPRDPEGEIPKVKEMSNALVGTVDEKHIGPLERVWVNWELTKSSKQSPVEPSNFPQAA